CIRVKDPLSKGLPHGAWNERKPKRSNLIRHHRRMIAGISLVVVNCGGLRYKFLNVVMINVAIGGWTVTLGIHEAFCPENYHQRRNSMNLDLSNSRHCRTYQVDVISRNHDKDRLEEDL
nr:hypothetical protein [Tanacetum cinerariifolium]